MLFRSKIEKEQNKAFKAQNRAIQQEKIDAKQQEKKEKEKEEQQNEDDESQFLGKDRRQLLNRIAQYKELFSELKTFKIKKGSSVEELQAYIIEIQCVIETSSIDTFLMDSIYTVMNLIEPLTIKSKYCNITGLTNLLKSNKQFNSLTKQMLLKYNCYSNVSPEYQILLIIVSSVYITVNKNNNRSSIESYLNEKI